jgi:hypothetical protein
VPLITHRTLDNNEQKKMPDEELRRGMLLNSGLTNYSSVREPVLQLKVYRANQVFVKRPNAGNNLAQPH